MDGETLTDLRFADDVALFTKTPQQMESQMNTLNNISKTVGLKMHKGKTKFMINYPNQDSLCIENEEIEKVEHYKYLGQTTYLKETTKEEIKCKIRNGWGCFGRNREVFLDEEITNVSQKTSLRPMCSPKYDIWLSNVVIIKSDGPEVENS